MKTHCPARVEKGCQTGFTLVELLVTLGILAVLTSLLLPALSRAKAKAQSIHCANNLRNLQVAAELYAGDNRGFFPPNALGTPFGYVQSTDGAWVLGNAQRDTSDANLRRGVLWDYVGMVSLYQCPSDRSTVIGRPKLRRFRGYSFSEFLNQSVVAGTHNWFVFPSTESHDWKVAAPAGIFAFICASELTIEDGAFTFGGDPNDWDYYNWLRYPAERHSKSANLSFLDGHVEAHRWLYTPKTGPPHSPVNDLDKRDLLWLIERTPYWTWPLRKGPHL